MQVFVRNVARLLRGGAAVPPAILHDSPITYATDGLITSHTLPFDTDDEFTAALAYVRSKVTHPCYHQYRLSMAVWCVQTVTTFGNFAPADKLIELGVGEGVTSLLAHRYFELKGRPLTAEFMLVDTFKGIDTRLVSAAEVQSWGQSAEAHRDGLLASSYKNSSLPAVRKVFEAYPNVSFLEGSCPEILQASADRITDIRFAHIDMNNAYPEAESLRFLLPRLKSPAIVLFDDYAFATCRLQRDAIDAVCRDAGITPPTPLPTGQGLLFR